ncbi:MAG: hypothetical protein AB1324_02675 [Candidatus Micrarchaeota archaeon]
MGEKGKESGSRRVQQAAEALRRAQLSKKSEQDASPPETKASFSPKTQPAPATSPPQKPPAAKAVQPAPASPPTSPATPPSPQPIPDEFIAPIKGALDDWWVFLKGNYKDYYLRLLKLNLSKLLATILFTVVAVIALFAAGFLLGGSGMGAGGILAIPLIILMVLAIIAFVLAYLWIDYTFESAALMLTHSRVSGKDFSIIEGVRSAARKTLDFTLIDSGLRLLVLLPAILLLGLPLLMMVQGQSFLGASMAGFMVAYLVFWVYLIVSMPLYNFAVQFWRFGFLLEGRDVLDSLKSGFLLLKSKLAETAVFVLLMAAIGLLFLIPYAIYYAVAYVFILVVQLVAMFIPVVGLIIYVALWLLFALSLVFFQTLFELSWRPLHYMFWKRIKG